MQRVPDGFWNRLLPLLGEGKQAELAKKLGVSQPTIARWRRRDRIPDLVSLVAVCRELGVSADELLGLEKPKVAPRREPKAGLPDQSKIDQVVDATVSEARLQAALEKIDRRLKALEKSSDAVLDAVRPAKSRRGA